MIGLVAPLRGDVIFGGASLWPADDAERGRLTRRFGVLYQSGALWSSMTLTENVGLPLGEFTDLTGAQIREMAALKLALVGLAGFEDFYPAADQRRHAEAGGAGPGHGPRSRHPVPGRAVGGARSRSARGCSTI